jgi:hypothetical protein
VTGSLFNEEEVEQTVNNAYQIHKKYIVSPSNQEWLLWISSGHIKECCMSSFDYDCSGIKSAIVISVDCFFQQPKWSLSKS